MKDHNDLDKCMERYYLLSKEIEKYFGIVGDPVEIFAMYEAGKHINLQFNNKRNVTGYDAIDKKGFKVEIKGARIRNKNFGYCNVFKNWKAKLDKFDYAILVSFNYNLDVKFVLKISADLIKKHFREQSNSLTISQSLIKEEANNKINKIQFQFLFITKDINIYNIIKENN